MDKEEKVKDQAKFRRVIPTPYFGYLVGQIREVIEAVCSTEKQQKAAESVLLDRVYNWWNSIGDKLEPAEADKALREHWEKMGSPREKLLFNKWVDETDLEFSHIQAVGDITINNKKLSVDEVNLWVKVPKVFQMK